MNATLANPDNPGLAPDTATVADENTARLSLRTARRSLEKAIEQSDAAMLSLRDVIVRLRPSGILTVDEMAEAIEHDRNYVDSVWSNFGETAKGRQTRVAPPETVTSAHRKSAKAQLKAAAKAQSARAEAVKAARAERNRVVAMVYASKILGPTAIAAEADVDRNHVLRLARKAGVEPMHRTSSRNQYSA